MPDRATLNAGAIAAACGVRVVAHDTVASTIDAAAADGGTLPVLHVAVCQTGGRGRRGRVWWSAPGNLHATIVWPDPDHGLPPAVLAAIQVACADAVLSAGGPDARVKWPNDGIVDGGKWCGVLASRRGDRVLVSLGANLVVAPRELDESAWPAVALADAWGAAWPGSDGVVAALLTALAEVLREGGAGVEARLARWGDYDVFEPGTVLTIESGSGPHTGSYAGVARDGRLQLLISGVETLFAAGDVSRVRRAG